jgi:hypothetical protein
LRISASGRPPRSGLKPRSCISLNATTNITTSTTARSTKGVPRLTCSAMKPPATEPLSMPTPVAICPRPKTDSRSPVKPVAPSASTSHASTAPEKKVKPRPINIETTAHCQNGAPTCQSST